MLASGSSSGSKEVRIPQPKAVREPWRSREVRWSAYKNYNIFYAFDPPLKLILPPICGVLAPGGLIVALIKPQFEVGKGNAPGGLVRDENLRLEARDEIVRFAKEELKLELCGLNESPIRGREMGNVEYLSYWRKP